MNRAIVTIECELCGKPRTGKYMSVGLICRQCYQQNAAEPKVVKKVTKLVRQTYEPERMRRFINEHTTHND